MQGFNKYYPPDWEPDRGSLNKFHGKHALGDRARKLDKGILIVRFELPFNIWCGSCENHIGQGVRYNAEKSKVGMYYSTPILNFRCKCHLCSNWFEIRTDPQNTRYVVHSGARQQNSEWDPAENGGVVLSASASGVDGPPPDPFAQLEKTQTQKTVAVTAANQLAQLEDLQEARWKDPYELSKALRGSFRKEKKLRVESEGKAEGIRKKFGLGEKVTVADLKTPVGERRVEEDLEWASAREEMGRRREERLGEKKRKLVGLIGWKERERDKSHRPSTSTSTSTSKSKAGPTSSSLAVTHTRLTSLKSKAKKLLSSHSSAAQSLKSTLLLNTALKQDVFGSSSGSGVGREKDKRREIGIARKS
ncbi:DUF572-domain-containing protein [Meredithblackwellia eburnea MCA 4105]